MNGTRMVRALWLGGVMGLFAVAVWFRVSSLEALPEIDGDEAWYGVQARHFLLGRAWTIWTPHHNPISPFQTGGLLLLLPVFGPELWLLRVPSLVSSLVLIGVTYRVGSRVLDRPTAVIAAGILAVLPASIVYSRTGYDVSHLPLFSMLAVFAALSGHRGGLALAAAAAVLCHPTAVFLAPLLAGVYVASVYRWGGAGSALIGADGFKTHDRFWSIVEELRSRFRLAGGEQDLRLRFRLAGRERGTREDGWRRGGPWIWAGLGLAALVGFGVWMIRRPEVGALIAGYQLGYRSHHDWIEFWGWFGRFFLVVGRAPRAWHDALFWGVALPLFLVGTWRLARGGHWDRVAIGVGVAVGAVGLCLIGGSTILQPGMTRYGLWFLSPAALAAACLIRATFAGGGEWFLASRPSWRAAGLLMAGWVLLFSFRFEDLTTGRVCEESIGPGADSIWSFGDGDDDPQKQALRGIARDVARLGNGRWPRTVLTADWNQRNILAYLAADGRLVSVVDLHELAKDPAFFDRYRRLMAEQAYGVGPAGGTVDVVLHANAAGADLKAWPITRHGRAMLWIWRERPRGRVALGADSRDGGSGPH